MWKYAETRNYGFFPWPEIFTDENLNPQITPLTAAQVFAGGLAVVGKKVANTNKQ